MASLVLSGNTSGAITVSAPDVSGSNTQTLVAATDTLAPIIRGTAVTCAGQTSIDFTGIPSWVKRITVMFNGVSTSGSSPTLIQLGTGSTTYTTSGYLGCVAVLAADGSTARTTYTSGFIVTNDSASAYVRHGNIVITNITGNTWTQTGLLAQSDANRIHYFGGSIALGAALTALRITTVNGTDTFDTTPSAGSINILYE